MLKVLVRKRETETILAGLGQCGRQSVGREVVELVDHEEEVSSLALGNIRPRYGGMLELGRKQGAE